MHETIGFWGCGNMGKAMMLGLIDRGGHSPQQICCISKSGTSARVFARQTGVLALENSSELIDKSDSLVLAFKPFQLDDMRPELGKIEGAMVLSLLAGKSLQTLRSCCPGAGALIRTMPNTPGRIGKGITAYCGAGQIPAGARETLLSILNPLGKTIEIEEKLMDVFTAVASSGVGFAFEFMAALEEAGVKEGLSAEMALKLARQTVYGAASLAAESAAPPEALRDQVTSKGGTTQAGLEQLATGRFRPLIHAAVEAAKARSIEMGGGRKRHKGI